MSLIKVDNTSCVKCGLCAANCPMSALEMTADGPIAKVDNCISCGHCVAVCPKQALTHKTAPLEAQKPIDKALQITEPQALQFLKTRRSIRTFQATPVKREDILKILDVARYGPTGTNTQGVEYLVVEKPEHILALKEGVISWAEAAIKVVPPAMGALLGGRIANYRAGKDVILLDAPCVVIATLPSSLSARGTDSAVTNILYCMLAAHAAGMGTCWAGFLEMPLKQKFQPVLDLLKLPADVVPCGAFMLGYPKAVHYRVPERNPVKVTFLGDEPAEKKD